MEELEIKGLEASINNKKILNGIDLTIKGGEIHVLMGPNGSGKSTLANVIMGNPKYTVDKGTIKFEGEDLLKLKVNERAKLGLFLAFQEPVEIPGVNTMNFIVTAYFNLKAKKDPNLRKLVIENMQKVKLSDAFLKRSLNEGFSGGEKKRFELLQLITFKPKIAVLDEIDSGLDIDSLKLLGKVTKELASETGFLMITHNDHLLDYIKPDKVSIIKEGRIVKTGDYNLLQEIKKEGFEKLA